MVTQGVTQRVTQGVTRRETRRETPEEDTGSTRRHGEHSLYRYWNHNLYCYSLYHYWNHSSRGNSSTCCPPPPTITHTHAHAHAYTHTHLDACVHLHEVEAFLLPQELDGAHTNVANGLGGSCGSLAHLFTHLGGWGRAGKKPGEQACATLSHYVPHILVIMNHPPHSHCSHHES